MKTEVSLETLTPTYRADADPAPKARGPQADAAHQGRCRDECLEGVAIEHGAARTAGPGHSVGVKGASGMRKSELIAADP